MAYVRINSYTMELLVDGETSMRINATAVGYDGDSSDIRFRAVLELGGARVTYTGSYGQQSLSFVPSPSILSGMTSAGTGMGTLTVHMVDTAGDDAGTEAAAEVTFTADESLCRPRLSEGWAAISPNNDNTLWPSDVYVKDSRLRAVFSTSKIQFMYGASAADYANARWQVKVGSNSAETDGIIYKGDTLNVTIPDTGTLTVVCTVNDSRGFTASQSFMIEAYAYAPPMLTGVEVYRCGPDGAASESGGYIRVRADVQISELGGANSLADFYAECTPMGGGSSVRTVLVSGGAALMGAGSYSEMYSYRVRICALDACGGSAEYAVIIPTANASLHILSGGRGAAFGKLSERENALDIGEWDMLARGVLLGGIAYMTAGDEDPAGLFGGAWSKADVSGLPIRVWERTD